jgi:hypothetical protein
MRSVAQPDGTAISGDQRPGQGVDGRDQGVLHGGVLLLADPHQVREEGRRGQPAAERFDRRGRVHPGMAGRGKGRHSRVAEVGAEHGCDDPEQRGDGRDLCVAKAAIHPEGLHHRPHGAIAHAVEQDEQQGRYGSGTRQPPAQRSDRLAAALQRNRESGRDEHAAGHGDAERSPDCEGSRPADPMREQQQPAAGREQTDAIGGHLHRIDGAFFAPIGDANGVGVDGDVLGGGGEAVDCEQQPQEWPELADVGHRDRHETGRHHDHAARDPLAALAEAVHQRRPQDLG